MRSGISTVNAIDDYFAQMRHKFGKFMDSLGLDAVVVSYQYKWFCHFFVKVLRVVCFE